LKKILIAYDGSEPAKAAMNFAFEIARYFDSDMHVIAVCQLPEFGGEVEMQDLSPGLRRILTRCCVV
jgi:nucleotide-binding universal stress UspA family protein